MKKQENLIHYKYKLSFNLLSILSIKEIRATLTFQEHFMNLKIIDTPGNNNEQKEKIKEIIKNVMKPLYYAETENSFYINFGVIRNAISLIDKITIELFNPICPSNISINLFKIESIGYVFNTALNPFGINQLVKFIHQKILLESKFLIEQFLTYFNTLKEGIEGNLLKSSEEKLVKCFTIGKKYYDRYIIELKKQDKLKQTIPRRLQYLPQELISVNFDKSLSRSGNASEIINENPAEIMHDSTIIQQYSLEYITNEMKLKTLQMIEDSILLFFQIASLESHVINLKKVNKVKVSHQLKNLNEIDRSKADRSNNKMTNLSDNTRTRPINNIGNKYNSYTSKNRSANAIDYELEKKNYLENINNNIQSMNSNDIVSTKTNSISGYKNEHSKLTNNLNIYMNKEGYVPDTPKFCAKYQNNSNINNEQDIIKPDAKGNFSYFEILKKIEEAKLAHSMLPTNEIVNIFQNTLEISHRKFFELCFEEYFSKLFIFEKDTNNVIKLDSVYSYFLYLRGLKNLLFTEKNKIYFSNVFFYDD